MIEAMACGTPVIAFPLGSVPEVIEEGRSGRIVGNREAAIAALAEIDALDRATVRECFDRRFTVDRMTAGYLRLYEKVTELRRTEEHVYGPPLAAINMSANVQPVSELCAMAI